MTSCSEITFLVPFVPVAKGRPRVVRGKGPNGVPHAFTPKKTTDFEAHVASAAAEYFRDTGPMEGPVRVDILAVFPRTKELARVVKKTGLPKYGPGLLWHTVRPDRDNVEKAVLDGLRATMGDDAQVCAGETLKVYAEVNGLPRVVVCLRRLASLGPTPNGCSMFEVGAPAAPEPAAERTS